VSAVDGSFVFWRDNALNIAHELGHAFGMNPHRRLDRRGLTRAALDDAGQPPDLAAA
jgi:hypothetical protein